MTAAGSAESSVLIRELLLLLGGCFLCKQLHWTSDTKKNACCGVDEHGLGEVFSCLMVFLLLILEPVGNCNEISYVEESGALGLGMMENRAERSAATIINRDNHDSRRSFQTMQIQTNIHATAVC